MKYTFVFFCATFLVAQEPFLLTFCIDEAVEIALNKHPEVCRINFAEKKDVLMQRQSVELAPLHVNYWQHRTPAGNNMLLIVNQNFGSIPEHLRKAQHQRMVGQTQQAKRALTLDELAWKVKSAYMDAVYYRQRLSILMEHAPKFEAIIDEAELHMYADSTSEIVRVSTGARYATFISRLYIAKEEAKRAEMRLRVAMNLHDETIQISQSTLELYQIHPDRLPSERFIPKKHNAIDDAYIIESQSIINLEKSRLFPAVHAGYVLQNLEGVGSNQGWMVGLSLPVWAQPQKARVKAAEINLKILELETQERQFTAINHVETLKSLLNEYFLLISFSRENLLIEAQLILNQIENDFFDNQITDYADAFTKMNNAVNAKLNYLEYISLYNQTALELEFFTQ